MEIVCAPETYRRFESSSLRQTKKGKLILSLFCFRYRTNRRGFEGGSHFARAKCFALRNMIYGVLLAKPDVDNVGAGRAAKGANPLLCAKQNAPFWGCVFCLRKSKPIIANCNYGSILLSTTYNINTHVKIIRKLPTFNNTRLVEPLLPPR